MNDQFPGPEDITDTLIVAMQGVMPLEEYLQQLNQTHFSMPVPVKFRGV